MSADSFKDSSGSAKSGSARVIARAKGKMHHGHKRAVTANTDIGLWTISKCLSATELSSDGPCKTPLLKIIKTCALMSALRSKPRVKNKSASVKCAAVEIWAVMPSFGEARGTPLTALCCLFVVWFGRKEMRVYFRTNGAQPVSCLVQSKRKWRFGRKLGFSEI
uniref:Uncharacterized protein n=1 Tax=Oryza meridionalis TaxID=40149 RepID=A0A0E0C8K5_9ORYZ